MQLLSGRQRPFSIRRRAVVQTRAVFEKFSERSIKTVMIAQQEAKNMGASEVGFLGHLLASPALSRLPD